MEILEPVATSKTPENPLEKDSFEKRQMRLPWGGKQMELMEYLENIEPVKAISSSSDFGVAPYQLVDAVDRWRIWRK